MALFNPDTLRKLNFRHPATWVATWFGCGLMRPGPGTWGTLGGLPFGIALLFFGGVPALVAGIVIVSVAGYWASKKMEEMTGDHDGSYIVIDEVAGIFIALIPAGLEPLSVLAAFILFRFFDILKPWPVSWLDKNLPGAEGVMLDDMMAGVYAAIVLIGAHYAGFNV